MLQKNLNQNSNKLPPPFSSVDNRPSSPLYDEYVLKKEDINSVYKSKYSKFNTSTDFIKTTISVFPNSVELINQMKIPIGMNLSLLSPFVDEKSIPVIDYGQSYDIPRCQKENCRAYLNPFVKFMNGSEQWQCNICKNINKTLDYYSCEVGREGIRLDQNTKPELNFGTYDFIAYKEFWSKERPPAKNIYYFLVDISQSSLNSGFAQCSLETIKDMIINDNFFNYENFEIKICIITYDEQINFYPININDEKEHNIKMLTINETFNELFLPTNRDFLLIDIKKYKNKILQIIENIQNNINTYKSNVKEADRFFDVVKLCNLIGNKNSGKILIFNGSNVSKLNLMNGLDSNKNNNQDQKNNKYANTDDGQIGKLGISLSLNGISVNIFECCNTYTNIKTLNQLIINTNGNIFFYRNFNPDLHYKNLYNQIHKILSNQNVFEGGFLIKFSQKFYISEYITPVLLYNKQMIFFPNLDSDQNYSFLLGFGNSNDIDEKPKPIDDDFLYIQGTLLYSRGDGQKRLRIFNLCFPISSKPMDIYKSINSEIFVCLMMQQFITKTYRQKNLIQTLNNFEKNYFEINTIYLNNLDKIKKELDGEIKLLSLYFLAMMKNCLLNKNEKGLNNDDDLTHFFNFRLQKEKIEEIICFIYPRIYVLDNILDLKNGEFPLIINNNKESMDTQGTIFLIDNGFELILFIKNNADKNIIFNIFGANTLNEINFEDINESNVFDYDENKNEFKNKIIEIIDNIRGGKSLFQNLRFVFENINDKNGNIINEVLVEDNFNKEYPFNYEKFYNKIIFV